MANWQWNKQVLGRQVRTLGLVGVGLFLVVAVMVGLAAEGRPKKNLAAKKSVDLTGIVDESFTDAVAEHALTAQQLELESLKKQINQLTLNLKSMGEAQQKQLQAQKDAFRAQVQELMVSAKEEKDNATPQSSKPAGLNTVQNPQLWHNPNAYAMNTRSLGGTRLSDTTLTIHTVSFRPKRRLTKIRPLSYLNPAHYVPSNTSVKAVILGGADADASVNGQSKNNGVMLFKFIEDARLPNGQRARLHGCRVSSNSYGDISSERAFATLYKLSCAYPGEAIIDKEVTGWVFYKGKVGIKGQPVMKDGKVMKWAGLSGALAGIASAAQYAQSTQSVSPLGATSVVSSGHIAPFAAYGAGTKSADLLSQYYIKRAEQYHPIIPVGAGNEVTIVFKDGFYLEPDEEHKAHALNGVKIEGVAHGLKALNQNDTDELIASSNEQQPAEMNFTVPPEVLEQIDSSRIATGGLR
ncbi:conjugal transfer pilus assembly protein TraB [Legionella massiliensis]|uniref:Conjugal transfer pilus assembly protein TraB n=1 Tax=Legionella massiliensis TaxID=1034943 RepID=A0A078L2G1_9GAMM|nr:TrbI/VirB10 family protein [Legionella massiliensis]CDZ79402.1 conjugal transfer pilus assembly protein TraB [Legionella massiliensis]CEE15140.1 Bacterial conjugation TrbI-like protein [Legionella massiliensis]